MASLDLGTLQVGVKVTGADKAEQELNEVKNAVKDVDDTSSKSAKGMKALSGSFSEAGTNTKGFGSSLSGLTSMFGQGFDASTLLTGAIGGLAAGFVGLATQAISQAVSAMGQFTKQSVQLASDLEESANVVSVVFGEDNNVTKWAEESASAFNLSRLEAEKFAGTMGAVLTPANLGKDTVEDMSVTLTKLSGDLGSLWNTSNEQAFNALRSAITGEMEPMKAFGVIMSQANLEAYALANGINKTWQEMNEAEKATLRYNYILDNTKTAQGDAARTADGYAGSTKQLSLAMDDAAAAMGSKLLPGLAEIKESMASFINDNKAMFEHIGSIIGLVVDGVSLAVKAFVAITKPMREIANFISEVMSKIIDEFREVARAVGDFLYGWAIDSNKTADDVEYEMLDMAKVTEDAMDGAAKSVEDSFAGMNDAVKSELDAVKSALDSYYDKERKDYQRKLEEKYGDSKNAAIRIAKEMAKYDERAAKQKESDYKQQEIIYSNDVRNFSNSEEAKTKKYEEETKKRRDISNKYSGAESSTSFTGTNIPRFANGTTSAPGGWSVVGETGRELMYVPPKAQIFTNSQTERMVGGGLSNNFYGGITVVANNYQEFIDSMEQAVISGEW